MGRVAAKRPGGVIALTIKDLPPEAVLRRRARTPSVTLRVTAPPSRGSRAAGRGDRADDQGSASRSCPETSRAHPLSHAARDSSPIEGERGRLVRAAEFDDVEQQDGDDERADQSDCNPTFHSPPLRSSPG